MLILAPVQLRSAQTIIRIIIILFVEMTASINLRAPNDLRKLNKYHLSQLGNVKQTSNKYFMRFWVLNYSAAFLTY